MDLDVLDPTTIRTILRQELDAMREALRKDVGALVREELERIANPAPRKAGATGLTALAELNAERAADVS